MQANDVNNPTENPAGHTNFSPMDRYDRDDVAGHGSGEAALVEAQVAALTAGELLIDEVETPSSPGAQGLVRLRGRLLKPSGEVFPRWLRELNSRGYTPMLQADAQAGIQAGIQAGVSQDPARVELRIMKGVALRAPGNNTINIVLYALTWISTLFVGSLYSTTATADSFWDLLLPQNLAQGLPFALTLLGILTAHELGHYVAARYHKVAVTWPYFIPMPLLFGTMGAFIMIREPIADRRKLFDIGVAGPLAGLVLAIPLLFYGLSTSPVEVPNVTAGMMLEGNSLLYLAAKYLTFGMILPNPATGQDVMMNQITFAAWIGLLVTAINLLPVGQLDGGHTLYAMAGKWARPINLAVIGLMALLGIAGLGGVQAMFPVLAGIGFTGWFTWLFLIAFVSGPYHPPALDDVTTIGGARMAVGLLVFLLLILIFVPAPMRIL